MYDCIMAVAYPDLIINEDYELFDDGQGVEVRWLTKQPADFVSLASIEKKYEVQAKELFLLRRARKEARRRVLKEQEAAIDLRVEEMAKKVLSEMLANEG